MRAKVNYGLSMAFDFDYYLVDEVTGVGDPSFKNNATNSFADKQRRSCMILVSHDTDYLKANCDICLYLHDGKIDIYEDVDYAIARYQDEC